MRVDFLIIAAGLSDGVTRSAFDVSLPMGGHNVHVTPFDVKKVPLVFN